MGLKIRKKEVNELTKRILTLLLVLVLALSLCACDSIKDLFGGTSDDPGVQDVDPNAPAHEQLMTEVNNRLVWAAEQEDVGMILQAIPLVNTVTLSTILRRLFSIPLKHR